jgi:hypothetical protein
VWKNFKFLNVKNLILLLFSFYSIAQVPTIAWQNSLGGSNSDRGNCIKATLDGGYIIAGESESNDGNATINQGNTDFWIIKLNNLGIIEWQHSYGGINFESANAIQQTIDGGYIVAGYSLSNNGDASGNHGSIDYWVIKLSSTGLLEWQKQYGGSENDICYDIQQAINGGFILVGFSTSSNGDVTGNHGSSDCWVVKIDSIGTIEWQKSLGGTNSDFAQSIKQTSDSGYILAGYTNSNDGDVSGNHGNYDYWVVKLNAIGTIEWQKTYGGSLIDNAYDIQLTLDGNYIIVGESNSNDGNITNFYGRFDSFIIKINSIGGIIWNFNYGGTSDEIANSIGTTIDGKYIVGCTTKSNNGNVTQSFGLTDYWIIKLSENGVLEWQKSFGGADVDQIKEIQQTSNLGYVVIGESKSIDNNVLGNHGNYDYWVLKLDIDTLTNSNFQTANFALYPNPTNNLLNFLINNDVSIDKVIITDISGKTVIQHTKNTNQINTENLANGMYFIEAFSGESNFQSKFIKK